MLLPLLLSRCIYFVDNCGDRVQVGLDNAGKTTTLYRLHLGEAVVTTPTVGSNVECVTYKNLKFEVTHIRLHCTILDQSGTVSCKTTIQCH